MVKNWPDSIRSHVPTAIRSDSRQLKQALGSWSKFFGADLAEHPIRTLVRQEIRSFLPELGITPLRLSGHCPQWVKRDHLASARQISRKFHLDFATIRRLNETGECVVRRGGHPESDESFFYDPIKLAKSVAAYRESINGPECSRRSGIPEFVLNALCEKSILVPVTDNDALLLAGERRYHRNSFTQLMTKLDAIPVTNESGSKFYQCMLRQFHPAAWADVIVALISGDLKITRRLADGPFHLRKVCVDKAQFVNLAASLPVRDLPVDVALPCTVGGLLLGVSDAVVGQAIHAGLLAATFTRQAAQIRLPDLAKFSARFMFGAEGRQRLGEKFDLSREMRAAGFSPVAVLKTTCLWGRKDAETFLGNRNVCVRKYWPSNVQQCEPLPPLASAA